MPRKSVPKQDDPAQVKRFIEMAKALEVDQRPGAFEKALTKVAKPAQPKKR